MIENPIISVVMPVYNCEIYIKQAIESILNQTLTKFELIIIDDFSSDRTAILIDQYRDDRIVFIKKKERTGLVDSLNMGFDLARGEFIARMDGDDISFNVRFAKQLAFLKNHDEIDICGTGYEALGTGEITHFPEDPEALKFCCLEFCPFAHPTIMFRKSFIDKYQLKYNNDFEYAEDYELWTRCVWLGKMANLKEALLAYRFHPKQVSNISNANQLSKSVLCRFAMLRKVCKEATIDHPFICEILYANYDFVSIGALKKFVTWMDQLVEANNINKYYDCKLFSGYIDAKKQHAIRRYFLELTSYSPIIFYHFLEFYGRFLRLFNIREFFKMAVKCAVFWRAKPS